jgi:hypothetical protein
MMASRLNLGVPAIARRHLRVAHGDGTRVIFRPPTSSVIPARSASLDLSLLPAPPDDLSGKSPSECGLTDCGYDFERCSTGKSGEATQKP